jgi:hypothetical protein
MKQKFKQSEILDYFIFIIVNIMRNWVLLLCIILVALGIVYVLDPEIFSLNKIVVRKIDFACIHPASVRV